MLFWKGLGLVVVMVGIGVGVGRGGRSGGWNGRGVLTGWVVRFQNPVCVFGVGDEEVVPFDLQVARCSLEEGWAREFADVESGFGWHSGCLWVE